MRTRLVPLAFASLVLVGCKTGPDYELPAGWEDARRVEIFQGPATDGCASQPTTTVDADMREGRVGVVVDGLVLSCSESYEGFVRAREGGYDLLLQPVDMHPAGLAGCSCATKLRAAVGSGMAGAEVEVYWRPSFEADPVGQPTLVGNANAEEEPAGCEAFVPCNGDTFCSNEGNEDPEEYIETCYVVSGCGPVCISPEEACMIDCGTVDCAHQESYPLGTACL
jgi:hypothetical protein